ncbi:Uncharacterised protein [Serratia ficaria]|uniref:hypothetical protein n=1 Tax=Serratia ficaria TaxID=61651 RepID=UPI002177031D|nr:hypothetical protein [Serratia ficaria]CAI1190713.1 Uncharacterised protein [Serratia ficaria]CAI1999962.1 Uncharacterised protein [Serratia ficaria]CAI2536083.1 Uncharacterised protein [Serratia ficaria]CAI2539429.1 Uncharacterised protein [Serratia ficaria]
MSSNFSNSFNQHFQRGAQSVVRTGTSNATRSKGVTSSFNHQERQVLHDLGQRMRGANANQHVIYQKALDELIGDRELTGADARLVALYAKTGSADGCTGSTEEGTKWGEALEALRDVE